jgi:D-beta-D-heptose 7-phosphate kinase/D-beta-D-heptose 1-phosphate adenosyltransferase
MDPAPIVTLEAFAGLRDGLGRIVCTSGGFDPLHPGHASCLIASRGFGDALVVVVNGDAFLRRKKGRPFMDLLSRCQVVACIRGVDYVVPFEREEDDTVCEALRVIRPHVFTKGGDRTGPANIPEWPVCRELGIELVTGVGQAKAWSSSDFLRAWGAWYKTNTEAGT